MARVRCDSLSTQYLSDENELCVVWHIEDNGNEMCDKIQSTKGQATAQKMDCRRNDYTECEQVFVDATVDKIDD